MSGWVIVEHRENDVVTSYTVQRGKFPAMWSTFHYTDYYKAKEICDRLNNPPVLTSKIIYP